MVIKTFEYNPILKDKLLEQWNHARSAQKILSQGGTKVLMGGGTQNFWDGGGQALMGGGLPLDGGGGSPPYWNALHNNCTSATLFLYKNELSLLIVSESVLL